MRQNIEDREKWSSGTALDIRRAVTSCAGYIGTPGWSLMKSEILRSFSSFKGLKVVELGCGLGKMSLVFSLLGARPTLVDYNRDQLHSAETFHNFFGYNPELIHGNILSIKDSLKESCDISMSFGTAEHFWGDERQAVFDSHASVLNKGGLTMVWVPNRLGVLFHIGRNVRMLLGKLPARVDETPFTRRELKMRAKQAGLTNVRIVGADQLKYDFHHFIFKLPHLSKKSYEPPVLSPDVIRKDLLRMAQRNNSRIYPAGNYFSYPLLLVGYRK